MPGGGQFQGKPWAGGGIVPNTISHKGGQAIKKSVGPDTKDTNAFVHDQNSSAASSSKQDYTIAFEPNILDNFDVSTYHWKLFITPLESVTSGVVLDPNVQTIIAESGVSDLTIDKVEIHGIAVPSIESGTGTMTNVKFEIVEPSGAGLIDKMFYQAQALGIGNWLVMPCFLQLEFRGRDPVTGESVVNGSPSGLAGLRWVWPVKLTTAKANVTNVGTRYEFDAIVYDEMAQTNSYFNIQHNTVLSGVSKFGKAMQDLEDKLNADQYEKLIDNYSIPDTYKIIVDAKLAGIDLVNPTAVKDTKRAADFVDLTKKAASFNSGTGIDKIVDSLLGSTKYFQEKMQNSATPSSEPRASNQETDQMKKIWRIVTETKPIAYDALRQDNAVAITIYIVEYDIGILDATPAQTGQTPQTLPAAKKRMMEYLNKKILQKKYDYIFTGLNDQIVSLDLNLNYSFAAALSRFGGIYYDSSLSDKGINQQKNAEIEKKATEDVRKTLQFINDAKPGVNVDKTVADAVQSLKNSQIDDTLKARYTAILQNAKPAARKAFTTQLQTGGGILANGTPAAKLKTAVTNANGLAQTNVGVNSNGDFIHLNFVSDVNINSQTSKTAASIAESTRKGKLRPVPYRETTQENNFVGIDTASDAGRSRTSSLFATALYSSLDASMQHIKLTIKGDPFWLFPRSIATDAKILPYKSKMAPSEAIALIKSGQTTQSVNILGTDNFIVIRFRTPRIYNEVSGVVDPFTEVETFSGVYKVTRIISKFEMGKFTQELECILDPVIDLSDFLREIEEATKRQANVIQTQPTTTIPVTAIKKQAILASNSIPGVGTVTTNSIGQKITTTVEADGTVSHLRQAASNIPSDTGFTAAQQLARKG